jgi:hypothetical protein
MNDMNDMNDPFATLRAYLDQVEAITDDTLAGIPTEMRDELVCRLQFAQEAVRKMAEILG